MNTVKKILTLVWKIWFALLTSILVLTIGVFWTYPLSYSDKTFPLAYKGIRLWAILIFYGSGFRLKVTRDKNLDKNKAYIFISNHSSILDIMIMAVLHKHHPIIFVGKEELAKIPIFGRIYRKICITVDRSDVNSRASVYKKAKEKINKGDSIVIFPEGGIIDDSPDILNRFKDGAFTIALSTGTPIAVYSIKGLKEMFPEKFLEGYPGKVKVRLLDIINTNELTLEDKNKIKEYSFNKIYSDLTSH